MIRVVVGLQPCCSSRLSAGKFGGLGLRSCRRSCRNVANGAATGYAYGAACCGSVAAGCHPSGSMSTPSSPIPQRAAHASSDPRPFPPRPSAARHSAGRPSSGRPSAGRRDQLVVRGGQRMTKVKRVACGCGRRGFERQEGARCRHHAVRALDVPVQHAQHLRGESALHHVRVLKHLQPEDLARGVVARHVHVKVEVGVVGGKELDHVQDLLQPRQGDRTRAPWAYKAQQLVPRPCGRGTHACGHHGASNVVGLKGAASRAQARASGRRGGSHRHQQRQRVRSASAAGVAATTRAGQERGTPRACVGPAQAPAARGAQSQAGGRGENLARLMS